MDIGVYSLKHEDITHLLILRALFRVRVMPNISVLAFSSLLGRNTLLS